MTRRDFVQRTLRAGLGACLAPTLGPWLASAAPAGRRPRKLIVVQFGGGTRYSESIGDPAHRYIPHLWNDLVPRGTLFTRMRVEGPVVHPNSTGSLFTGHWEWKDLDWTRPVAHPTLFELYRRASGASDLKTWAFVYASILAKAGESLAAGYGARFGANVVVPPTIPRATAELMEATMREATARGTAEAGQAAARICAGLARAASRISLAGLRFPPAVRFMEEQYGQWKSGSGSTSHDAFLTDCALACLERWEPDILAVCFGEIDCAHFGAWSRYVEAIQRTDALTWRLWQSLQALPAYRDNTLFLILPDHGRELEASGGSGFVHHSDFYTNARVDEGCRRVWMLALGPGVPLGRTLGRTVPITTVAGTGLEFLGLAAPKGAARSAWSRMPEAVSEVFLEGNEGA